MKKFAVIVAGGSGLRMGTAIPKQFLPLKGRPLLWYTLEAFLSAFEDISLIVVLPHDHLLTGHDIIRSTADPTRIRVIEGGTTRFHSVKLGLAPIQQHSMVFVHDGVRCLISTELIHRCYATAQQYGNAIPAIPAHDTIRIKTVDGNRQIDRNKVRIIQTPQTFYSDVIKAAFEQEYDEQFTDEASVVERLGIKIELVEGELTNIKITQPIDLLIAEKVLEERNL
jgi:2-C-methyl-D-erythritol 4-phosphate cytidylyltransferase